MPVASFAFSMLLLMLGVSCLLPLCYGSVMITLFLVEWCVVKVARKLKVEEYSEEKYEHIIQKLNKPVYDPKDASLDSKKYR